MFWVIGTHPFPCGVRRPYEWWIKAIHVPVEGAVVAADDTFVDGGLAASEAYDRFALIVIEAMVVWDIRLPRSTRLGDVIKKGITKTRIFSLPVLDRFHNGHINVVAHPVC